MTRARSINENKFRTMDAFNNPSGSLSKSRSPSNKLQQQQPGLSKYHSKMTLGHLGSSSKLKSLAQSITHLRSNSKASQRSYKSSVNSQQPNPTPAPAAPSLWKSRLTNSVSQLLGQSTSLSEHPSRFYQIEEEKHPDQVQKYKE